MQNLRDETKTNNGSDLRQETTEKYKRHETRDVRRIQEICFLVGKSPLSVSEEKTDYHREKPPAVCEERQGEPLILNKKIANTFEECSTCSYTLNT